MTKGKRINFITPGGHLALEDGDSKRNGLFCLFFSHY